LLVGRLFGLLIDRKDGSSKFLRNFSKLLWDRITEDYFSVTSVVTSNQRRRLSRSRALAFHSGGTWFEHRMTDYRNKFLREYFVDYLTTLSLSRLHTVQC
jgi:hypothetical protein